MAPDQEAYEAYITKVDQRYLRFAAICARHTRAMYKLLEPSPTLMEKYLREVIEDTKLTWDACRESGIQPDGSHP